MAGSGERNNAALIPYVPRLMLEWARDDRVPTGGSGAGPAWRVIDGTMVFADISGFTKMSERLARHGGKVGAEEVTDAINTCFEQLLGIAYASGGSLLKFGGDALLLLFTGEDHASLAAHAAVGMRLRLRTVGRLQTTAGQVVLRISMGIHSGAFHVFAVGDSHRELIVAGPAASATVAAEGTATAGEIVMSAATAALLPARSRGPERGDGYLLRSPPGPAPDRPIVVADAGTVDVPALVPSAIRRHLVAGGEESEHRSATVAFLHFDGTDEVLTHSGPAVLAGQLDEVVRVVQRAADEHEVALLGSDIDHDGGKLILVAGVPRRAGDDEERMLSALRQISDADLPLALRIGAHTGPVFAGAVGPDYRRTFTVMGDTVNLAARVMSKAAPGEVLATPDVIDRSQLAFETESIPPFNVKGKRRPVIAFVVGAPKRTRRRRSDLLPFVGRDEVLAALADELDAAEAGAARFVQVLGDPGMGKSRLVEELRAYAEGGSGTTRCITTRCEAYESSTPYAPFWVLLRYLLDVSTDDTRDDVARRLRSSVGSIAPDLLPSLSLIATVVDVEITDTPEMAGLTPEFRRQRVDEVTAAYLARLLPHPVALVFEDAHHMDEPSVGLLHRFVALAVPSTLLCVTRRAGDRGFRADASETAREIELLPLTMEHAEAALLRATEDAPLLPIHVRTLAERSAGNPMFLDEMLRAIGADGDVDALPATIDAAVTAQIDRLPPRLRQILRRASVLGQSFATNELTEMLAPDLPELDRATLDELSEFLVADGPAGLRFRFGIMRDSAYEELPFRQRRVLHGRAADALERTLGADIESEAGLVSLHSLHAQRFAETWRYAALAGNRAKTLYANAEAAVFFERALAAARRLPALTGPDVAGVWELLGDVRERAGEYEYALRAYRNARRLLDAAPSEEGRLLLKEAWIAERNGRYQDAVRAIRKGFKALEGVDGPEAGSQRAQLWAWYGAIRQAQGRHREAITSCERAIEQARASDSLVAEAHASFILDWAWVSIGHFEAATHSERALAIYVELGDLSAQATVLQNLGGFAYYQGRWDEAVSLYERSRAAYVQAGNEIDAAMSTCNIAEVVADQGRYEEAEDPLHDALRLCRAAGYLSGAGFARGLLGRIAARTKRFDEARTYFDLAHDDYSAAGLDEDAAEVDGRRAECLMLEGRADEALALAEQTINPSVRDDEISADIALLQRVRGCALMQMDAYELAREALAASLDAGRAREADYEVAVTLAVLARLGRATGDAEGAQTCERESAALLQSLGVVRLPVFP